MFDSNPSKHASILLSACIIALIGLGLTVITGWITHSLPLLQLHPDFAPMQVNTAIGFLLCGLILLAFKNNHTRLLQISSHILIVLSSLTLLQYITNINFGIDELFLDHYLNTKTSHPGRMSPNTALCFLLIGAFSAYVHSLASASHRKTILRGYIYLLPAIPFGLAIVTLTGYALDIESTYGWGDLTRMALHTAAGFGIMSAGIFCWLHTTPKVTGSASSSDDSSNHYTNNTWWVCPLSAIILTTTLILSLCLNQLYKSNGSPFTNYLEWAVLAAGICMAVGLYAVCKLTRKSFYQKITRQIHIGYILLSLGTLGALIFYTWMHNNFEQDIRTRFLQESVDTRNALIEGFNNYENILLEARDDLELVPNITQETMEQVFKGEIARAKTDLGFVWAPFVIHENRIAFEEKIRGAGNPNFSIVDISTDSGKHLSAPTRPYYFPSTHSVANTPYIVEWLDDLSVEQTENQRIQCGIDWSAFDNSIEQIALAIYRDGASAAPLGIVKLPNNTVKILLPIYKRDQELAGLDDNFSALRGVLIAIVNIDQVLDMLINYINPKGVGFQFQQNGYSFLANIPEGFDLENTEEYLQQTIDIEILGSQWSITTYGLDQRIYPKWSNTNFITALVIWAYIIGGVFYNWRQNFDSIKNQSLQAYLQAIVGSLPIPLYVHNKSGEVLLANDAANSTLDQKNFSELINDDLKRPLNLGETFQDEVDLVDESKHLRKRYIRQLVDYSLPNGTQGTVGALSDITELKNAESNAQLAASYADQVFDLAPMAMVISDDKGHITKINKHFTDLLGYTLADIRSCNLTSVIPAIHKAIEQLLQTNREKNIQNIELTRTESENIDAKFIAITVKNEILAIELSLGLIQFCSEQKVITAIKDVSQSLVIEGNLRKAKQQADAANQAKSDFLATMSHEIRTPMNAIIGMTSLALDSNLTPRQQNYLNKASSSAKTLLRLINDILDYSKAEAGHLEIDKHPFNFQNEVLTHVANIIRVKAGGKDIEFLFDTPTDLPAIMNGDALRINQVLINLLDNAVKFTESGQVELRVTIQEMNHKSVLLNIAVVDTGIGMTQQQMETLFDKFTQADNSITRRFGGTGLGLSISKKLVELMGGEIQVQSIFGKGTTFEFNLPLERIHDTNLNQIDVPEPLFKKALVIDDNETALKIVSRHLDNFNIANTTICCCSKKVLDALHPGHNYDLILIDKKMADLTESSLIESQPSENHEQPKIILLTATDIENDHNIGFDFDVLKKPISPSELYNLLIDFHPPEHEVPTSSTISNSNILAGSHLLLVEDNETNQEVAVEFISRMGITCSIADNGEEALKALENQKFDGVLMDMQMPVMDGITATKIIRNNYQLDSMPIIAMTANAAEKDKHNCLDAGMNDYIAKPISPALLKSTLEKWIRPTVGTQEILSADSENPYEIAAEPDYLNIEGIHYPSALHYMGGNKAFLEKMLKKFARNQKNIPALIESAIKDKCFTEAERLAHTLKGLAKGIGAEDIGNQVEAMEIAIVNREECQSQLEQLQIGLSKLIQAINSAFDTPAEQQSNSEAKVLDQDILTKTLISLKAFVADWDTAAVDTLSYLETLEMPEAINQLISQLHGPLSTYDFEAANSIIGDFDLPRGVNN